MRVYLYPEPTAHGHEVINRLEKQKGFIVLPLSLSLPPVTELLTALQLDAISCCCWLSSSSLVGISVCHAVNKCFFFFSFILEKMASC